MKWKNKGKELSGKSELLKGKYSNKKIYIYGAGLRGIRIFRTLMNISNYEVEAFIDKSKIKQKNGCCGKKVLSLKEIRESKYDKKNTVVLLALEAEIAKEVKEELVSSGLFAQDLCIGYEQFFEYDLPPLSLYEFNKCFVKYITLIVTEKCTLKCEKCAIRLPYFKDVRHYTLDKLKEEVDLLFKHIDFIGNMNLTGGEPLLFEELANLIEYIGRNYGEKIGTLQVITNGTLCPDEKLIQQLVDYNVTVEISDYTRAVPGIKSQVEEVIACLKKRDVNMMFLSSNKWVDFGFDKTNNSYLPEEQIIHFFDYCHTKCRGYIDGEIIYCINAYFAARTLGLPVDINNKLSLTNMEQTEANEKIIVEFENGYSEVGYIEMCKRCNGTCEINKNYIEVGIQCGNH